MTYRAAYLAPAQSAGLVMTTEDQAHLSDAELIEAAVAEGHNAGLIGDDLSEEDFRDQLIVGEWND